MFDLDLHHYTDLDKQLIIWNANIIPNYCIKEINGSKQKIIGYLLEGKLLEKVEIDLSKKSINLSNTCDGFVFVKESIPIINGAKSLIYHGSITPNLHKEIELFDLNTDSNLVFVLRRVSVERLDQACRYEDYFAFLNKHLSDCILSLNKDIDEHNRQLLETAQKCANNLNSWYLLHPDQF